LNSIDQFSSNLYHLEHTFELIKNRINKLKLLNTKAHCEINMIQQIKKHDQQIERLEKICKEYN